MISKNPPEKLTIDEKLTFENNFKSNIKYSVQFKAFMNDVI